MAAGHSSVGEAVHPVIGRRPGVPPYNFFPETFVLPLEYGALRKAASFNPEAIWIRKPAASSNGRGVRLAAALDRLASARSGVVQRYLDRPHLIDGYKYVLRLYVAMTSLDPFVLYLYDDGLTKIATRPYTIAPRVRTDRLVHVTNVEVQARNTKPLRHSNCTVSTC